MLGVPAFDLDLDDFQAAGEFKSSSASSYAFSRGSTGTGVTSRRDRSHSPARNLSYGGIGGSGGGYGGGGYSGGGFDGSGSEEKEREPMMMVSEASLLADLRMAETVLGGGGGGGGGGGVRDSDGAFASLQVTSVDEQGLGQRQGQSQGQGREAFFGTAMSAVDE